MSMSTDPAPSNDAPALIALDWGSSSLRGYLMSRDGRVLVSRSSDAGASRITTTTSSSTPSVGAERAATFERHLRSLVGDWLDPAIPVVACGMVGSAHGWLEAGYLECPIGLDHLHRHLAVARGGDGLEISIVPGVSIRPVDAPPDVMRGEETQVAGLLYTHADRAVNSCVVLPGTHSKWVRVAERRVVSLATRMTGELFDLLRTHSVLSRSMPGTPVDEAVGVPVFDSQAFGLGLERARGSRGTDLSHHLFGVRTSGLFGELGAPGLADYLSGLLIGHELAAALRTVDGAEPILLVGEERLCARYAQALRAFGCTGVTTTGDSAALGLWSIARAAALLH